MRLGWFKRFAGFGTLLLVAQACAPGAATEPHSTDTGFTVYLVRHAEKADGGDDPALTAAGLERAETLATMLADEGIEAIWSTDYERTRSTAAPLAQRLRLPVRTYDPSDLGAFARKVEGAGETALVVGHSNTTPELSALLGGETGGPITEAGEYDRLYVLTGIGTDTVETQIQRFGASHDDDSVRE